MVTTDWQPSASIEILRQRAAIISLIRDFFNARGYLEVETPVMARFGVTDVYLRNIKAMFREKPYFLQTSPEYHMKRLLAAGSGSIFQLARVFRDDEIGRWHNPEFTLLEWYHLSIDHLVLLDEVEALLKICLGTSPLQRITYKDVFLDVCGFDPNEADVSLLKKIVKRFNIDNVLPEGETDPDQYLFLLMSHVIEPRLAIESSPVAVYHFPPSQASLAKVEGGVAQRFEIYYRGVELANGFNELTNAEVQRQRFEKEVAIREITEQPAMQPDAYLLSALKQGLPACSGVALGLDRLVALATEQTSVGATMAFDFSRA